MLTALLRTQPHTSPGRPGLIVPGHTQTSSRVLSKNPIAARPQVSSNYLFVAAFEVHQALSEAPKTDNRKNTWYSKHKKTVK